MPWRIGAAARRDRRIRARRVRTAAHEIAVAAEPAWAAAIEHNLAHAVYNDVIVDANGGVIVAGETTESVIHVDETDLEYELRRLVLAKYDADGEQPTGSRLCPCTRTDQPTEARTRAGDGFAPGWASIRV